MNPNALAVEIHRLLEPLGFSRNKFVWNRSSAGFVDVIDLQVSKAGDAVTLNAGVVHPETYRAAWGSEMPDLVEEPFCMVRARIGQLIDRKDLWWPLVGENIAHDVACAIQEQIIPFLEGMHSTAAMEGFLLETEVLKKRYPPPIIYLAVLKKGHGDAAGACQLLTELFKKSVGSWKDRIEDVQGRIGCGNL